jgi:hypothetical protein
MFAPSRQKTAYPPTPSATQAERGGISQYIHLFRADALAILVLVALWLLFFWRLFTPIAGDQASLTHGDFSGQFVAFAGYQYERFSHGEVPLWNPYNNGGLPFIADTQAAVFYPPRLVTIGLSKLAGGWTYHALELEMTVHVLVLSLLMYALVRRMSRHQPGSVFGAFVAAVIAGYSGFTSGYPLLQLALLEAAIWLPLAVFGVLEATRTERISWRWLMVTGAALGLSWLAGHPQTSYFLTLLLIAFYAYRCYRVRIRWPRVIGGVALFGAIAFGLAAVQLLPGLEYLGRTARTEYGFDAKGNGFPFQDVLQFIFPAIVSQFSPLYVGVTGILLAIIAAWRRVPGSLFWAVVAVVALLWSFGANSAVFPLLYNLLPGLRFFRGQERAAFLASWDVMRQYGAALRLRINLNRLFTACLVFFALVVVAWLGNPSANGSVIGWVSLSLFVVGALLLLIPSALTHQDNPVWHWLLAALLVFELFTVSMDADAVFDSVPPTEQLLMTPPPLIAPTADSIPYRVDGFRGLTDNYGSLYGIMDMRGISPLFLSGPFALIEPDKINPRAWELFAVRYVWTDWQELPVPSEIIATGEDRSGAVNLHQLSDPRPFAYLLYDASVVPNDELARQVTSDPSFDPRERILLQMTDTLSFGGLSGQSPENVFTSVTEFAPEAFKVIVDTPENAVLSLAHPDYPGWYATLDGEPVDILRAYGALTAVAIPSGEHTVQFVYNPLSYRVGAVVSVVTVVGLLVVGLMSIIRRGQRVVDYANDDI